MSALIPFAPLISAGFTAFSALSGSRRESNAPAAPEVSAPTVMPTGDSALVAEAKRRSLQAQAARGGRNSTILSDSDSETFGGN